MSGQAMRGKFFVVVGIILLIALLLVGYKVISTLFSPASLTQVYLDNTRNVHVVTDEGKDVQLTTEGKFHNPKLASNNRTVGWLILTELSFEDEVFKVTEELVIYRDGKVRIILRPGGFIRDWQFWENGEQVAIYTGALHFAGSYLLFDIETGEVLDESGDVDENPPDWALYFRTG
jgi:hypothetical protein